jgi:hypothetical protein
LDIHVEILEVYLLYAVGVMLKLTINLTETLQNICTKLDPVDKVGEYTHYNKMESN